MSEVDEILKQAIVALGKKRKKFTLIVGAVKAIEGDTCTVDDYEDVQLNAIIEDLDSQFTVYPKVGSKVVIARLDDSDSMFIIRHSEIEKITIKINDQLFEMKDGKFTVKSGELSLKSILNDGFDQLTKAVIMTPSGPGKFSAADVAIFNQLKTKTNQLLS
ncbi:hypothetical protein [Flavobacterium frigoris]|uniref:Uncharacterized protein n=1 Tax=Flavobacterium frigoris TaxID=229204 RepID=A0A1H9LLJ9_FLAFI|nr:hypothetical protein [Flavobacterium frigoris]SER12290.1 hypothetical protein SAMN05444355_10771 [Flavobacterium frigoris]